ncbi:MAG: hypothetical protein JWP63_5008 [Candidatus Solibacter sp.]|nr:hypothetical protein [Candidatus Solibacter sp.]
MTQNARTAKVPYRKFGLSPHLDGADIRCRITPCKPASRTNPHPLNVAEAGFRARRFAVRPPCYGNRMRAATGLDGLLDPLSRCLDAESSRRVVEFRVDPPVQERIDSLAERANEGTLSDSERSEYEALINAADFISILKLKARLYLDSQIR